ncbi:hypothetical protein PQ610_00670 [Tardisphaera miroshnichenkoae]
MPGSRNLRKLIFVEGPDDLNFYPCLVSRIYGNTKPERIYCPALPPEMPSKKGPSYRFVLVGDTAYRDLKGFNYKSVADSINDYLVNDEKRLFSEEGLEVRCYKAGEHILRARADFSLAFIIDSINEDPKKKGTVIKKALDQLNQSLRDRRIQFSEQVDEQEHTILKYGIMNRDGAHDGSLTPVNILLMHSSIDKIIYDIFISLISDADGFNNAVASCSNYFRLRSKEHEYKLRASFLRVCLVGSCTYLDFMKNVMWKKLRSENPSHLVNKAKDEFRDLGLEKILST